MHYSLNWAWNKLGYWIAGIASFAMLVALPFHFFFAFTGLPLHPADVAAPLASVDAMMAEAKRAALAVALGPCMRGGDDRRA